MSKSCRYGEHFYPKNNGTQCQCGRNGLNSNKAKKLISEVLHEWNEIAKRVRDTEYQDDSNES